MAKTTKVKLVCPSLGEREFEVSHAERLLAMPKNGGWQLPKDSSFVFENGSISRRNKKESNGEV